MQFNGSFLASGRAGRENTRMAKRTKPISPFPARRRALLRQLGRQNLPAAIISRPADVSYLTGFAGEHAHLVLADDLAGLVVGPLYLEQAQSECKDLDVQGGAMSTTLPAWLKGKRIRRLAAQGDYLTHSQWEAMVAGAGSRTLIDLPGLVDELRLKKDDGELRRIKRAVTVAEKAFTELMSQGRKAFVGRTEGQVAAELDYRMRLHGATAPAFDTIVAAGAGSSQPHYQPSDRKIRRDEPVLIDWGARVKGYCSDLTRVVLTGKIPPIIAEIYDIVARAQRASMQAIRPGVSAGTIDGAARRVIADSGRGEQFIHSVGHGLGREVHESPPITGRNTWRLRSGVVFTVEPGIYVPGLGGVRLEDDVVVTARGYRKLSTLPVDIEKMVLR